MDDGSKQHARHARDDRPVIEPGEAVMGRAEEQRRIAGQTGYDDDIHLWAYEQAELVRQKRFDELDLPNIVEELESMGSEIRFRLEASYRLLIAHLLKHVYQPSRRSRSWLSTITRERGSIERIEEENPSLKAKADRIAARMHRYARKEAAAETGLPIATFPAECPFTLAQLRDDAFLPER